MIDLNPFIAPATAGSFERGDELVSHASRASPCELSMCSLLFRCILDGSPVTVAGRPKALAPARRKATFPLPLLARLTEGPGDLRNGRDFQSHPLCS